MMWVVIMLLPSLAFTTVKAQDTLVLDIKKALEIALSENPTVKVPLYYFPETLLSHPP